MRGIMSDDDSTQNDSNASGAGDGSDDTSNDTQRVSGDAGTSNDTSSSNDTNDATVTRAEYDQIKARMQAADKRAADLQTKIKEWEDKDKSDLEKAQGQVETLTQERDDLRGKLKDQALQNAFLTDNKYSWHDPRDALRLMDMEGVDVSDDGSVSGLKPAIEKLAKAKPHLVKVDDSGNGKGSSGASGSANNGTRKGGKPDPPKNYSSRFPALRTNNKQS